MIGLLIRLPIVLALLVPLTWAAVLLVAGDEAPLLERTLSDLEAAYPSGVARERMLRTAIRNASALLARTPTLGGDRAPLVHAGLVVCGVHFGTVLGILPATLLLSLCGVSAGLVFRERIRMGAGYASPTAAGLGRGGVGAGILWLALFGLSPLPVSFAWLYLSAAALALGGTLFVANLPLKL